MIQKQITALVVLVLASVLIAWWMQMSAPQSDINTDESVIACTMDAMQCPDGSYVGRTGPRCEFVCPTN